MTHYTLDQALINWRNAFDSGHLTAARAWWAIVRKMMEAK